MKRIFLFLFFIGSCICSFANLLQEKIVWDYAYEPHDTSISNGVNDLSSSIYEELTLLQFIDGTEEINGKVYHYVWGTTSSVLRDDHNHNMVYRDYPAGPGLWINAVNLNLYPAQIGGYAPVWKKILLVRQDGDKIYLYVDRDYKFTEPVKQPFPTRLTIDWKKFESSSEDELLVYDFGLRAGEESSTVMCDPKDGTPQVVYYQVTDRKVNPYKNDPDEVVIEGSCRLSEDAAARQLSFSNRTGMGRSASLFYIFDNRNVDLENIKFDRREFPAIPDSSVAQEPVATGIQQNIFYYRPETGMMPVQYFKVEREMSAPDGGVLLRYKYLETDGAGGYTENECDEEIVRFRKENGKIRVRCRDDWRDSETMSRFGNDEELLYIDLNLKKGDILNTFSVKDGIVTRLQKKVFGLTTAANMLETLCYVLTFYDENGNLDTNSCYIDGIGFFDINIPDNGYDGPTSFLKAVKSSDTGKVCNLQQYQNYDGYLTQESIEEAFAGIPYLPGVYNMQGIKVGESVENLPAGFYIVNGRKILVR